MTDERRYLWFAPHAGLWPSFRMEHRLAQALVRGGRSVVMVHCYGVLDSYCPVMAADRLTVDSPSREKGRVCVDCRHAAATANERAGYPTVALDDLITDEVRQRVAAVMREVTPDTWADVEVDGLPVGRYSTYLALLHHKVPDVTATPEAWREYQSDLRNALHVALVMPALLDRVRPTHAVVYNPLYPTNRMFAMQAQRHGAQLVGLHAGSYIPARTETVGIYQHISASQTLVDSGTIAESMTIPATPAEVAAVGRHFRQLTAGSDPWVYSTGARREEPSALRVRLGLRPEAPVVVALLSSPDETRASLSVDAEYHRNPERGYSDVPEFVAALRALATASPDLDLVLRLHPRLMPNKRDSVVSPDLEAILAELQDLPSNAHINVPADEISLYDLIGIASAAVNQSSSSGLEFMALGLPVVSFDPNRQNAYPPDFGPCVDRGDPAALTAAVASAVAAGPSNDNSVRAVRWYATVTLRDMLLMSRLVADDDEAADAGPARTAVAPSVGTGTVASTIRRLVPDEVRERVARALVRRGRASTIPSADDDAWWQAEWLERLDAARGDEVVWEPPIIVRGDRVTSGGEVAEAVAVAAMVADLRDRLGYVG